MKEKLKNMKIDVTLSAVLSIAIGVLFVFWPAQVTILFARVLAVILIDAGAINFISKLITPTGKYMGMVVSLVIALIGVWIFVSPTIVAQIIPIAIGVLLVVHGVQDVALALEAKANQANNWWSILLMAALNLICGVICICNAFGLVVIGMIVIGIMMIYDGLSDMFIVHKVTRAAKDVVVDSQILHEEDVEDYQ